MATAKNDVFYFFIGLNWVLVVGKKNLVGRRWMSKFLVGEGLPHLASKQNHV